MGKQKVILYLFVIAMVAVVIIYTDHAISTAVDKEVMDEGRQPGDDYWNEITGGGIDPQLQRKAIRVVETQMQNRNDLLYRDAGINSWEALGPLNIGGRSRALAVNPENSNELVAGSAGGGIWKSLDAGHSWSMVSDDNNSSPITHIVHDPTDPAIMYATTGAYIGNRANSPGKGVLKSLDSGNSWAKLESFPSNIYWISRVVVNPEDSDVLYVTGTDANKSKDNGRGKLWRSGDAGASWHMLWEDTTQYSRSIMDIMINPDDTSKIIIGTLRGALISNDSGESFSLFMGDDTGDITTGDSWTGRRCEVEYCRDDPSVLYVWRYLTLDTAGGHASELWRSTNSGDYWIMLDSTIGYPDGSIHKDMGDYCSALWVDPGNCGRAVVGGIDIHILENNDLVQISRWQSDIGVGGGVSAHADQHFIIEASDFGQGSRRVYFANDGGIYSNTDIYLANDTTGWVSHVNGMNITQMYTIDVSLTGDTLVAGSQDNSYFVDRSGNGNDLAWLQTKSGDGGHCAIKKSAPDTIWASTQYGKYRRSSDGGDSFCPAFFLGGASGGDNPCEGFVSVDDDAAFVSPLEMDPNNDSRVYVGGSALYRTDNDGLNWIVAMSDSTEGDYINAIAIADGNSQVIWIAFRLGRIVMTANGGADWDTVMMVPNGVIPQSIAINPGNHDEVLLVLGGGYSEGGVFYTDDAGASWEERSADIPVLYFDAIWHPENSNWAYVGTDIGILATENDGEDWNATPFLDNSEGPRYVPTIELVWQGNGSTAFPYYLVAATYGRGAWRTSAPIRKDLYVDKNCNPCGEGTMAVPFKTLKAALEVAGSGCTVHFLSGGTYDEVPATVLIKKRVGINIVNQGDVVLIE